MQDSLDGHLPLGMTLVLLTFICILLIRGHKTAMMKILSNKRLRYKIFIHLHSSLTLNNGIFPHLWLPRLCWTGHAIDALLMKITKTEHLPLSILLHDCSWLPGLAYSTLFGCPTSQPQTQENGRTKWHKCGPMEGAISYLDSKEPLARKEHSLPIN